MDDLADRLARMPPEERTFALEILPQQLVDTGEAEDLHLLLSERAWMHAQVARAGDYGTFLSNVRLARRVAEATGPAAIGHQVRYALLEASINSLSGNIPPYVLAAGLRANLWSTKAALAYARQVPHGTTRVAALTEVATYARARGDGEVAHDALGVAMASLREIDDPSQHAAALRALAPHLPADLLSDALAAAQEIYDQGDRAAVLSALAPYLRGDTLAEALDVVRDMESPDHAAAAFAGLAPYLPRGSLPEALDIVRRCSPRGRAVALAALAPHLTPDLVAETVRAAQDIYSPCYRTAALMALPGYGDADGRMALMRWAIDDAREGSACDSDDRLEGLLALTPYLPPALVVDAFEVALAAGRQIPLDPGDIARVLVTFASRLPAEAQANVVADLQQWSYSLAGYCADILSALAPHLPPDLMLQALETARGIIRETYARDGMLAYHYPAHQVPKALVALGPFLPRELMPEAMAAVRDIENGSARGFAIAKLAPHLSEDELPEAVRLARAIESDAAGDRAMALAALSERGLPWLLDESLTSAQHMQEYDESVIALPALLAHGAALFPEPRRTEVRGAATNTARAIYGARYRAEALAAVAEALPEGSGQAILDEAIAAARDIPRPRDRALTLRMLVPQVRAGRRDDVVAAALAAAEEVEWGGDVDNDLAARAVLLPPLAPYLSEGLVSKALGAARALGDPTMRGRILAMLAPHLAPDDRAVVLGEALAAARAINADDAERGERAVILAAMVPHVPEDQRPPIIVEMLDAANATAEEYRGHLGPLLASLAPHLPPEVLPTALAFARDIWSAHALAALSAEVPEGEREGVLADALAAADALGNPAARAGVLTTLAPMVGDERRGGVVSAAVRAAQQIGFPGGTEDWGRTLMALAPLWAALPQDEAYELWLSMLRVCSSQRRTYFLAQLAGLVPVILALGKEKAVIETISAVWDTCGEWPWASDRPRPSSATGAGEE